MLYLHISDMFFIINQLYINPLSYILYTFTMNAIIQQFIEVFVKFISTLFSFLSIKITYFLNQMDLTNFIRNDK